MEEIPLDPLSPPSKLGQRGQVGGRPGLTRAAVLAPPPAASRHPPQGWDGGDKQQQPKQHKRNKARRFSARCWMAPGFPIPLQQLAPLLEVVGRGNKTFVKAADFVRRIGASTAAGSAFPVRAQIPILWTVHVLLSFRAFELLGPGDATARAPGLFEVRARAEAAEDTAECIPRRAKRPLPPSTLPTGAPRV